MSLISNTFGPGVKSGPDCGTERVVRRISAAEKVAKGCFIPVQVERKIKMKQILSLKV